MLSNLSQRYVDRKKEEFRFYDDLHPRLRQFLREASYEWSPITMMSQQHSCQGNEQLIEDLYEELSRRDKSRFQRLTNIKLIENRIPGNYEG